MTAIPTVLLGICVCIALEIAAVHSIFVLLFSVIFVVMMALIGLALNLKMPNLNWTDPTVPVKQSLCVMIALFGGWAIITVLGVIYLILMKFITPLVYLVVISVVGAVVSALLLRWIDTKGAKIFDTL